MSAPRRVAWVVGVGGPEGTGAALARRFAGEGLTVVVTGRSEERLAHLAARIAAEGGRAVAAPGDASDERQMQMIAADVEREGALELGVFNAGNNRPCPIQHVSPSGFEEMWRVACLGGFTTAREMVRLMLPGQRGTLIFTGATASLRGKPRYMAFASAKAGLRMVAQSFAREFGPLGLHIAHTIIDGRIGEAPADAAPQMLSPDDIADAYWALHRQRRSAWTHELDLRPASEAF